jgi:hypothetical protein
MSRQYWVAPLPPFHTADGTTATAAALAEISPRPPVILPANVLEPSSRLEFQAFGRITQAATPGTCTIGIYIGSSDTIASGQAAILSASITGLASRTNTTWRMEGNAHIRSAGSGTSATILGALEITGLGASAGSTDLAPASAPTAFAFDSTVANFIKLGYTPSVATASMTCHYFGVRLVN